MTDTATTEADEDLSAFDWSSVQRITGGFRVKTNDAGTHYVDVLGMIYNWRVALTPVDDLYFFARHFCYAGNDIATFLRALAAAASWDGALDTEPEGWNKNGQTGEWREPQS